MRNAPACVALGVLALLAGFGCGRDTTVEPRPRTVSGAVVLVGAVTAADARVLGTRVVADADGIPVELVSGTRVVASTATFRGRYTFDDVPNGSYLARARVAYDLLDASRVFTVADGPVEVADTLRVASRGDLFPWPNPFSDTLSTSFYIAVPEQASLRVLDVQGNTVRVLLEGVYSPGANMVPWNAIDAAGYPVPNGLYWIMLVEPGGTRAQLLHRG